MGLGWLDGSDAVLFVQCGSRIFFCLNFWQKTECQTTVDGVRSSINQMGSSAEGMMMIIQEAGSGGTDVYFLSTPGRCC